MTENNNTAEELLDILGAIEIPDNSKYTIKDTPSEDNDIHGDIIFSKTQSVAEEKKVEEIISTDTILESVKENKENDILETLTVSENSFYQNLKSNRLFSAGFFGVKYLITSVFIFGVLLLTTNYSAYLSIAESYIFQDKIALQNESLLNSVNAQEIQEKEIIQEEEIQQRRVDILIEKEKETENIENNFSMKSLVAELNKEDIDLGIAIVPYENRIVIPKIGKNIPLVDIKESTVEGESQLNNIFMKELEDGIVRYPGSAKPGEKGNSFVFGHSSNFPWIAGDYNDVFSKLGQVEPGDVVFSYYGQKKYKYKIIEKKVITPDDVDILKRNKDKSELTLMTCWPVGTTLNRLILIGELIEE